MIFSTPFSMPLARKVARAAQTAVGRAEFRNFADGERYVRISSNVRGRSVAALGSTPPPAENWIDLLFLIRALKENGARRVTAVLPYLGYARQDHVERRGEFVALRLAADLIAAAGADRVILVDPHPSGASRFFRLPATAATALPLLCAALPSAREALVVAPDRGAAARAREAAGLLGARQVVIFRKFRPRPNEVRLLPSAAIPGAKSAVIIDDMIDTGGTVIAAVKRLRAAGIRDIKVASTHPVLSRNAIRRIRAAGANQIVVADTIGLRAGRLPKNVRVVTVGALIAKFL